MTLILDNPKSRFHSWQWQGFFLMSSWVFTQQNNQSHQAITLKVIWTKHKRLKTKASPFSTAQSKDCKVFLSLEKWRAYIMIKLWVRQVSCHIVWTSRKIYMYVTWATRKDGEDSGHLHPFKIPGFVNLVTGPRRQRSQDQSCGNKNPCKKSVIKKMKFIDTSHWKRGNIHQKTYDQLNCSTKFPGTDQLYA